MASSLQKVLKELASGRFPSEIPDAGECAEDLRRLTGFMKEVKRDISLLAQGVLAFDLKESGPFAGAIKALQANLRHLTWQTQRVAEGDFTQRVDFMGEFAVAFNTMVEKLDASRREILRQKEVLEKAYADLKAAQVRILEQEKMAAIGQLAAGVAHEINNPTGFILSNLTTLKKYSQRLSDFIVFQSNAVENLASAAGPTGEEFRKTCLDRRKTMKIDHVLDDMTSLIDESAAGSKRVQVIVQSLKDFSHVDEADHMPVDINEALDNTLAVTSNLFKDNVTVIKDYGDLPKTVCNSGQLNQVFLNVLKNAAEAMKAPGGITVRTMCGDGSIVVTVSDTGCGIPPDVIGRVFEPFFTTKDVGAGTGLGLSIAYDIVKRHHGSITVKSEQGRGTDVTIIMPVVT
jgi:two-component system NtrC family sensor kinase